MTVHATLAPPLPTAAARRPVRPRATTYEPFDAAYCRALEHETLGPVAARWFRARLIGADRLPLNGPIVLAANHSGNAFPYDAIVLDAALWRHDGLAPARKIRSLFEPELAQVWWMRLYGLDNFWRRGGGVDMTFDNFDRLLERGERVLYFPEGVPGIGKGFHRRYQLQQFKTSFVLLAARHRAPVYPVYVLNAEWVHPFGYPLRWLDRVMQRVFHVPFLPLPIGLLAVIFPWMWWLAFPARMRFVVGRPIDLPAVLWQEGLRDVDHSAPPPDRAALRRVAERVRRLMQSELATLADRYGRRPWHLRSLWRALRRSRHRLGTVLPIGWPVTFVKQDRDRRRPPARSRWQALLRDWDLLFFYIPLAWPLLSLARRLRRPPYGYRGLSRDERRERCGEFIWRLSERQLPPR